MGRKPKKMTILGDKRSGSAEYLKRYYARNREKLLKKKNDRYKKDSEFRDRVRAATRDRYHSNKGAVVSFGTPIDGSHNIVEHNGKQYYSTEVVAKESGIPSHTIRRWLKSGKLPPTYKEEGGRLWWWFTTHQLILCQKLRGYSSMSAAKKEKIFNYLRERWNNESYQKNDE